MAEKKGAKKVAAKLVKDEKKSSAKVAKTMKTLAKPPVAKKSVAKSKAVPAKGAKPVSKAASSKAAKPVKKVADAKKTSSAKKEAPVKKAVVLKKTAPSKKNIPAKAAKSANKPAKAKSVKKGAVAIGNPVSALLKPLTRIILPDTKTGKLTKTELKFFKNALLALRDKVFKTDAAARQNVKHHNEADTRTDYGANAFDKFLAYGRAGNTNDLLTRIDEALARIEAGTYGKCLMCGEPIRRVRLEVQPFSRHCIKCQELLEKSMKK